MFGLNSLQFLIILLLQTVAVPSKVDIDCGIYVPKDFNWYYVTGSIHYVNDSTHVGSIARVRCERGYDLVGPNTAYCGIKGKWIIQDRKLYCAEHKCERPDYYSVPNGVIHQVREMLTNRFIFGSAYAVTCNDGYVPNGTPVRTCLDNGTWSDGGAIPQCIPTLNKTGPCNESNSAKSTYIVNQCHWGEHISLTICGLWALIGFSSTYKLAKFTERYKIVVIKRKRPQQQTCNMPKKVFFSIIYICLPIALQTETLMRQFRIFFSITNANIAEDIGVFQEEHKIDIIEDKEINCLITNQSNVMDNLRADIDSQRSEISNMEVEIKNQKVKIGSKKLKIDNQKQEIKDLQAKNTELHVNNKALETKLDATKDLHESTLQAIQTVYDVTLEMKQATIDDLKIEKNRLQTELHKYGYEGFQSTKQIKTTQNLGDMFNQARILNWNPENTGQYIESNRRHNNDNYVSQLLKGMKDKVVYVKQGKQDENEHNNEENGWKGNDDNDRHCRIDEKEDEGWKETKNDENQKKEEDGPQEKEYDEMREKDDEQLKKNDNKE